jgi:diguanylate cyclase (GGDEF)-like protein
MTSTRLAEEPWPDAVSAERGGRSTLAPASKSTDLPGRGLDDAERPRLDPLVANFARILNSEVALYYQPDGKGQLLPVICSWGLGPRHEQITRSHAGGLVGRALGAQRAALEPLEHDHDIASFRSAREIRLTHAVAAPVRLAHRTHGVLVAGFSSLPQDTELTLWRSEACAATLGLCLHQPGALDALFQTNRHDTLTGCLTYAAVRQQLDREINRSARASLPLSLCFIDLDRFKRINDWHGHLRGNEALAEVGRVLRNSVRSYDTVGRFGGDEFIAILPETTEPYARQLAERLRSRIAAATTSSGERLTASVGAAQWVAGTTAEQLLAHADQALLLAKARADREVSPSVTALTGC